MIQCPSCGNSVKADFGMVSCPKCSHIIFLDVDGNVQESPAQAAEPEGSMESLETVVYEGTSETSSPQNFDEDLAATVVYESEAEQATEVEESEDVEESLYGQAIDSDVDEDAESDEEIVAEIEDDEDSFENEEEEFEGEATDSEDPEGEVEEEIEEEYEEYEEVDDGGESESGEEEVEHTASSVIDDHEGKTWVDARPDGEYAPEDLSEIADYGNSEMSVGKDGQFLYDLRVSGIDSSDIKSLVEENISDRRLALNVKGLLKGIKSGVLEIKKLNAIKTSILVNRLKSLPVSLHWRQNVITQVDPD